MFYAGSTGNRGSLEGISTSIFGWEWEKEKKIFVLTSHFSD